MGTRTEMVSPPVVSVVVPTLNRSRLLALTLQSIIGQVRVELEAIVVDDGSSDDTPEMLAGLGDPRVRVLRHDAPQGVSAARNRGIAEARGQWVGFCDDDDLWAPDKLARQLEAAADTELDWVCAGHVDVTPQLRVVGGGPPASADEIMRLLPFRNVVPGGGSGVIVLRDALERTGGFDGRLHNTEDWELWLRLARHGPPAVVNEPVVAYRLHPRNASLDSAVMLRDLKTIEAVHGIRASRGALYSYLGWWALRGGRRGAALMHFLQGFRYTDDLYLPRDALADLAYLARDTALAVPSGGRRRARPSSRREPGPAVMAWRRRAQAWVDELVERSGGSPSASSQA